MLWQGKNSLPVSQCSARLWDSTLPLIIFRSRRCAGFVTCREQHTGSARLRLTFFTYFLCSAWKLLLKRFLIWNFKMGYSDLTAKSFSTASRWRCKWFIDSGLWNGDRFFFHPCTNSERLGGTRSQICVGLYFNYSCRVQNLKQDFLSLSLSLDMRLSG